MRIRSLIPVCLAMLPLGLASADTMKCGPNDKWTIDEKTAIGDVIDRCGTPTSKTITKEGDKMVERWFYRRGTHPMLIKVADGKIMSITPTE